MAAKSNENLQTFKKRVRLAFLNKQPFESTELYVVAIHRYISDPKHASQTGTRHWDSVDVLQLTLADGQHKTKVILSPQLNKLVQTNQLRVGHVIIISQCRLHYDEQDLSGGCVVIVEDLRTVGHRAIQDQSELADLVWCDDCSHIEQMDIPLTSSRGYFVNVWSSRQMYGSIWRTSVPETRRLEERTLQGVCSIRELRRWGSVRSTNPAVLARVLCKSRLLHYVKPGKDDKWPFQAHMLVADRSGACTAVLWNAMCPNFYHSIKEGNVLLLKGFTVKKSFTLMTRFTPALKGAEMFDIDINLNSHHPASDVTIIHEDAIPDGVHLPSVRYTFVTRKQLGGLPYNFICDVIGVVTYIGRFEREPILNKLGDDSGGFWLRRWLHLVDGTGNKPFYVLVYRPAEGMEEVAIRPGEVLLCSHVRVINPADRVESSRSGRHVYLTTTAQSQIDVIDDVVYRSLDDHTAVSHLWAWRSSPPCGAVVGRATLGGYFTYPPLPTDMAALRDTLKDTTVLASEEWQSVLSSLSYREARQVLVQALLVQVTVRGSLHSTRDHEGETAPSTSNELHRVHREVVLDPEILRAADGMDRVGSGYMDEDVTPPMKYRRGQWGRLHDRLEFPRVELGPDTDTNTPTDAIGTVDVPYFTTTWHGLNSRALLHSLCVCPADMSPQTTFMDVIAGRNVADNALVSHEMCGVSAADLESVLTSAWQCANKRFLLVLDCYHGDNENLEVILNRALPLT